LTLTLRNLQALAVALPIGRILSFQGDNSGTQLDNNVA